MKRIATILSLSVALLGLLTTAQAQTAVSIPLGSLNVTATPPPPPPPPAFTQQVSQVINTTVTINGAQYTATGTLAGTVTFTPMGSTGGTTPAATPIITGVGNTAGTAVSSANGGSVVVIQGANFGTGGTVTVASLPATVISWTPTAITVTLAKPGGLVASPVVVTPTGGAPVTSSFNFTITLATTVVPSALQPWLALSGFMLKDGSVYPKVNPVSSSVVPGHIRAGDPITILGQHFGTYRDGCRVEINYSPVSILSWTDSAITVQTSSSSKSSLPVSMCLVWRDPSSYCLTRMDVSISPQS